MEEKNSQQNIFLIKLCNYSIQDVLDTREDVSPQKRTSSTLKHEISIFVGHFIFALLDPDPDPVDQNQCRSTRIRSIGWCRYALPTLARMGGRQETWQK
jgi:hypothetical protein